MLQTETLSRIYALFHAAKALVSLLGPIYLLNIGFGLREILFYFILVALVKVLSLFGVFPLVGRFGPRVTMLFGVVMMMLHFGWFAGASHSLLWLVGLAASLGVANAFFYPSFRINFSLQTTHDKTSRNVARLNNYATVAGAAAPVLGGFVASFIDIRLTYAIAAVMFGYVAYLVYRYDTVYTKKLRFAFKNLPRGSAVRDYVSNSSYSFSGLADLAVWPLYLAMIIPTYAGVGLYAGFIVVAAVIVQVVVGRYDSVRSERSILYGGVLLNGLYNIGRVFVTAASQLIGLGFLSALSGAMLSGSYGSRFYKNIHPKRHLEYLFAMEVANSVTWLLYFPALLALSYVLSYETTLRAGVLLVIPAAFGMLFMRIFAASSTAGSR